MALPLLFALSLFQQESIVPPPPRLPLPRPVANAPLTEVNSNTKSAGTRSGQTLTLSLDIIEAAYQPEGPHDPVVRAFAFAEPGKAPVVPGPMIRAPLGTTVQLTLRNRTDSALFMGGLRPSMANERDTVQLAPGASREVTFKLDRIGNFFYWAALKGLSGVVDVGGEGLGG